MTDATLLHAVGEALYGPRWQSELARLRGVDLRRVQRWAKGEFRVPAGIWGELRADLEARRGELDALAKKLPR